jgi:hypothetical protein
MAVRSRRATRSEPGHHHRVKDVAQGKSDQYDAQHDFDGSPDDHGDDPTGRRGSIKR